MESLPDDEQIFDFVAFSGASNNYAGADCEGADVDDVPVQFRKSEQREGSSK